ncbi:Spa2p [Sugiyamaella lignohabitans]|uniref:Spa2p n=1 Tax=Sugiyamaella lignohabitans TaxID=796027 RepID=A0A167E9C7_9ASCO|nr:Spa2p [Sugiyamaella lignohabitans]ANB13802.1 Spa2p [Sugiyamaella lignohabitans]
MSSVNYNQPIHSRGPSLDKYSGMTNSHSNSNLYGANGNGNPNTSPNPTDGSIHTTRSSTDDVSIDDTIASYHHTFCQFTGHYNGIWDGSRGDGNGGPSAPGSKARQKLEKLSKVHFSELSTDVYDELVRRVDPLPHETEFLAPRDNIHRKRNQARQKLAMLSPSRFNDLASDILYEIERRYPNLRANPPADRPSISDPNDPNSAKESPALGSTSQSPYLTTRRFSNASAVSNATSRYTSEDYHLRDSVMPPRNSSLNTLGISSPAATPPMPSESAFTHQHNASIVPPLQEEVSIPPSNRSAPLAQPIKSTTIIPTKSTLVEEDDDDDEEGFEDTIDADDEADESAGIANNSTFSSNGSVRNSKRLSMLTPLSDIEEEADAARLAAVAAAANGGVTGDRGVHDVAEDEITRGGSYGNEQDSAGGIEEGEESDDESVSAKLRDRDEQIQMLVAEGSRMDETINNLESRLQESETVKTTLEEENNRLHDMVGELEEQRQKAVDEKESIQKRLEALEQEVEESKAAIAAHEATINSHKETIDKLGDEKKQSEDELSRATGLLTQLREEHANDSDLQQANARHVETIAGHETTIDNLQRELDSTKETHSREIDDLKQQHESQIAELTTSHSTLKDQVDSHANEKEELTKRHQQELDELVNSHSMAIQQYKTEAEEHKANLVLLQESHSALEQEHNNIKDRHAESLSKQNEYAESSATLSNDYLLLQNKLTEHETVSSY